MLCYFLMSENVCCVEISWSVVFEVIIFFYDKFRVCFEKCDRK